MQSKAITVLLCTVRDQGAYINHPDWDVVGQVIEDLSRQEFKYSSGLTLDDIELVVVDGCYEHRDVNVLRPLLKGLTVQHMPPRRTFWTERGKVAICAFRNTGIMAAQGELIVNLDDCCRLPTDYLEPFWLAYKQGVFLSATWPGQGDTRPEGLCTLRSSNDLHPFIYGFGSYSREAAIEINGYEELFDGAQGLEDGDFSLRLALAGYKQGLADVGLRICAQGAHSDKYLKAPGVVKCPNPVWLLMRSSNYQPTSQANTMQAKRNVVGPCPHLNPADNKCGYHNWRVTCQYAVEKRRFPFELTDICCEFVETPYPWPNIARGF